MDRIVVGVDGSKDAEVALRWAVEEGDRHGATVEAVMAWSYLDQHHADRSEGFDPAYGEEKAREALQASVDAVGPRRPPEQRLVNDLAGRALLEAARGADLVVVGARGLGGFKGLLLGSVSERVLEQATCPVAIVRQEENQASDAPVVVGIDGSEAATAALHWAAGEARVRKAALRVVHAWRLPVAAMPAAEQLVESIEQDARDVLDEALADPALDELRAQGFTPYGGSAHGVLEHADGASLIVVGSRGLGRLGRVLLGSSSRQLAHHAPCPIVVVRASDEQAPAA